MRMDSGSRDAPRYESLIARHIKDRLASFTAAQLQRILDDSGLALVGGQVRAGEGGAVDAEAAYRYKQAIRSVLGPGAYSMTKVNFALAGCLCRDCQRGVD